MSTIISTYRIQLSPSFGFQALKGILPYLAQLGSSHIYASPIFKARKGSTHGYDIVNPNELNPELGSSEDFENLIGEMRNHGMYWLQDIVPNHMAFDNDNQMIADVLENNANSPYFSFFDIEWNHFHESMKGRLLAPFLGEFYGKALEDGEICLQYSQNGLAIKYNGLTFPLKMESYVKVFNYNLDYLKDSLGEDHPDLAKFMCIFYTLSMLHSKEKAIDRHHRIKFTKSMLWELYNNNPNIRNYIDESLNIFNGIKGNSESYNLLDNLLSEQLFRLSFWKVANEEINYRRFFTINDLISLRVEDTKVFDYTHNLILKLIENGTVSGLRVDHIDGLYDPTSYIKTLRERAKDAYILVEKILDFREELPASWPIQGTTGYDFLNYVNGIFCERRNERRFSTLYTKFTGLKTPFADLVHDKKRLIIGKYMAGNVDNLAYLLKGISARDRHGTDITLYGLKRALVEVMAFFPVYRTYISQETFTETDRLYIKEAVMLARQANPGMMHELNYIEKFLSPSYPPHTDPLPDSVVPSPETGQSIGELQKGERENLDFIMRFQQITGTLMAKGFEDTVLYVYNRLLSLNEVGGNPSRFGVRINDFHDFNKKRAAHWPLSLNATSMHDTKRGEDVRARLNVLSEIPGEWDYNIRMWMRINKNKKTTVGDNIKAPDKNDEYFLYQTLIGSMPFDDAEYLPFVERVKNYIIKAVREAKVHTAWLKPDEKYEGAFISFIENIMQPYDTNSFLKAFLPFQKKVAYYGIFNSLSQTFIKLASPGVPDFYQGAELWDLNMVDPDNRRPVDFDKRNVFLQDIFNRSQNDTFALIAEMLSTKEDGRLKLFLVSKMLKLRRERKEVFQNGDYLPIEAHGRFRDHIIAFARSYSGTWIICIAPRFFTSLMAEGEFPLNQIWEDTYILLPQDSPTSWKEIITERDIAGNGNLSISDALKHFPVALLVSPL